MLAAAAHKREELDKGLVGEVQRNDEDDARYDERADGVRRLRFAPAFALAARAFDGERAQRVGKHVRKCGEED